MPQKRKTACFQGPRGRQRSRVPHEKPSALKPRYFQASLQTLTVISRQIGLSSRFCLAGPPHICFLSWRLRRPGLIHLIPTSSEAKTACLLLLVVPPSCDALLCWGVASEASLELPLCWYSRTQRFSPTAPFFPFALRAECRKRDG